MDQLAQRVRAEEQAVAEIRKSGSPAEIIAAAEHAADAVERLVTTPPLRAVGAEREAFLTVKRFLYNAAADCWPGWSVNGVRASDSDLKGALALARRSAALTDALNLGPKQQGTAAWLIGAFELALRSLDDATTSFLRSETLYGQAGAPSQRLLARGYWAIAREAAGRAPSNEGESLDEALKAIAAGNFPDGEAFCNQLRTARRIFVSSPPPQA